MLVSKQHSGSVRGSHHVNHPSLEDPIGQLFIVSMRNGGRQLLALAKLVGCLLLGAVGLLKCMLPTVDMHCPHTHGAKKTCVMALDAGTRS